jgi:ATP-dependent Zn protease
MGHALVAKALPGMDPVHKISTIPRGIGALGYTIQRPIEDRFLMTRRALEHKMAVLETETLLAADIPEVVAVADDVPLDS